MDFGVPKMGFLVFLLGVIERGVVININSTGSYDDVVASYVKDPK